MIIVELDTDHSYAIKYNKPIIELVNPLQATIFRCHFKLLQKITDLKGPKRLIRIFYLDMSNFQERLYWYWTIEHLNFERKWNDWKQNVFTALHNLVPFMQFKKR